MSGLKRIVRRIVRKPLCHRRRSRFAFSALCRLAATHPRFCHYRDQRRGDFAHCLCVHYCRIASSTSAGGENLGQIPL